MAGEQNLWLFGPNLSIKTERTARSKAAKELRRRGFRWDRSARRWVKDNGYGLINYQQRWIVLCVDGIGVYITDREPPRQRARQMFLAHAEGSDQ